MFVVYPPQYALYAIILNKSDIIIFSTHFNKWKNKFSSIYIETRTLSRFSITQNSGKYIYIESNY